MNLASLGDFLRQEREKRGVTIEQVASATKISVRLLHALESDQYADLPAKPFIRGFVNSYSRFIGLDPKDVLTRYGRFIDDKSTERLLRDSGHSGYAFEKKEEDRGRTVLWGIMGSLVVLSGVFIFVLKPALKHKKITQVDKLKTAYSTTVDATANSNESEGSAPATATAAAAADSKSPAPAPSPAATVAATAPAVPAEKPAPAAAEPDEAESEGDSAEAADPLNKGDDLKPDQVKHKIVFKALENIWVRYKVDSRPLTKFMLLKGKYLVLKAEDEIRFQVSNPRAVQYRYKVWQYKPMDQWERVSRFNETPTVILPEQRAQTVTEPFPGQSPLPSTPDPSPTNTASG